MTTKNIRGAESFSGAIWKDGGFVDGELHVRDGRIREGRKGPVTPAAYITPPLCDPHIHGGWGLSFREKDFLRMEHKLRCSGVGCAVPTLDNDSLARWERVSDVFLDYREKHPDTIFPFLRVEGPFISPRRRGFQDEKYIFAAEAGRIERFLSIEAVKMFTFAPEAPGSERLVREAMEGGRIPSVGHSDAGHAEFLPFHRMGVRHMTHFPNAMRGLHHRDVGLLGSGLLLEDMHLEIIADGIHNCREFLSLVFRWAHERVSLTSDMISPAHAHVTELEGRSVDRRGRSITMRDGTLAGGGTGVAEQMPLLASWGHSPKKITGMAVENARRFIGFKPPELKPGERADFLLYDEDLKVRAVYFNGVRISEGVRSSGECAEKEAK